MAAAAHGGNKLVLAGKPHRRHNVHLIGAKRNERGSTVNPSVPDASSRVVAGVLRAHEPPAQLLT